MPEGFGVDGFRLSSIDRDARTVRIGCHTLSFDEIELAGAAAGYPPGTPIPLPPIAPREGDGGYKTATAEVAPEPATA